MYEERHFDSQGRQLLGDGNTQQQGQGQGQARIEDVSEQQRS